MENLRLFLSQKPQFEREEKIKNKNKKRTRASLFRSSEDGKQEILCMWPKSDVFDNICGPFRLAGQFFRTVSTLIGFCQAPSVIIVSHTLQHFSKLSKRKL